MAADFCTSAGGANQGTQFVKLCVAQQPHRT
jgi:hypothetical protein